jgi:hypothetical protein
MNFNRDIGSTVSTATKILKYVTFLLQRLMILTKMMLETNCVQSCSHEDDYNFCGSVCAHRASGINWEYLHTEEPGCTLSETSTQKFCKYKHSNSIILNCDIIRLVLIFVTVNSWDTHCYPYSSRYTTTMPHVLGFLSTSHDFLLKLCGCWGAAQSIGNRSENDMISKWKNICSYKQVSTLTNKMGLIPKIGEIQ